MNKLAVVGAFASASLPLAAAAQQAGIAGQAGLEQVVSAVIEPLMSEHDIPGMAVAVLSGGERHFFNYGAASPKGEEAVTENTLFEIGSVSKTFTATLAAYAEATGKLALSDKAASHLPALEDSPIGDATLDQLGTYAAAELPLQFPDSVVDEESMIEFYRTWQPDHSAGTHRLYSNPSIGLMGYLAAEAMGKDFDELIEGELLPAFGLSDTFVNVPPDRMDDYAWGTSRSGEPIRVSDGALGAEAYGIKTSSADLLRFLQAQIDPGALPTEWRQAVEETQEPRYAVGPVLQGLGWEMYAKPAGLDELLEGTSAQVIREANEVLEVPPAEADFKPRFVNKTGSTNGFGAYVLFDPAAGNAVVILANRFYPNPERIEAGYAILSELTGAGSKQ